VWIFSDPNPPIRGGNTIDVLVTDTNGQPISDAKVSFDINMTNMNHGKNVVTASSLDEGRYSGEVFFLMPGPWRVIVGIERAGQTNTVRFDFMVNFR
jgi:nitrogen fixation protein FixH